MTTMTTPSGRNEFAPPPTPGFVRSLGLAMLAHGLLVAMLTLGVQWKRDTTAATFEAELWSALPQEAAPPAPAPEEPLRPLLPMEPPVPPKPLAPPPPVQSPNADIVVAKEKAKLLKEKQLLQEKLEQEKQAKLKQERLQKEKLEQAARDKQVQAQKALDAKAAEAAKQKNAAKAKEDAKKLQELRQQNLQRMAGMAGVASGNGNEQSRGTAAQSSGPSAGYAGRIRALLKRNTTYTDTIVGNPKAEVEVRTSPDGTIISRKLVKSSGVKSWDDAVLNAIDKTEVLPRDVDGRIPSPMLITHSPN